MIRFMVNLALIDAQTLPARASLQRIRQLNSP